jgi:hypothetical protein
MIAGAEKWIEKGCSAERVGGDCIHDHHHGHHHAHKRISHKQNGLTMTIATHQTLGRLQRGRCPCGIDPALSRTRHPPQCAPCVLVTPTVSRSGRTAPSPSFERSLLRRERRRRGCHHKVGRRGGGGVFDELHVEAGNRVNRVWAVFKVKRGRRRCAGRSGLLRSFARL